MLKKNLRWLFLIVLILGLLTFGVSLFYVEDTQVRYQLIAKAGITISAISASFLIFLVGVEKRENSI